MRVFTKEEIEERRRQFRSEGFREKSAEVGDLRFSYFVIPQELNRDLPHFTFRMTGKNKEDSAIYGIADSVREDFRPYAVAHEVIEFSQIGVDVEGRCVKALEKEISLVPEDIKGEYLAMRKEFFDRLIPYASSDPSYTKEDVHEFRGSLEKLDEILFKHVLAYNLQYNERFQEFVKRTDSIGRQHLYVLDFLTARGSVLSELGVERSETYNYLKEHRFDSDPHHNIFEEFENKAKRKAIK